MQFNGRTACLIGGTNLIRRLHLYMHRMKLRAAEGGVQGVSPWERLHRSRLPYLLWHLHHLPRRKQLLKTYQNHLRLHRDPFRLSIGSELIAVFVGFFLPAAMNISVG